MKLLLIFFNFYTCQIQLEPVFNPHELKLPEDQNFLADQIDLPRGLDGRLHRVVENRVNFAVNATINDGQVVIDQRSLDDLLKMDYSEKEDLGSMTVERLIPTI